MASLFVATRVKRTSCPRQSPLLIVKNIICTGTAEHRRDEDTLQ
jgi:hypothetical protein